MSSLLLDYRAQIEPLLILGTRQSSQGVNLSLPGTRLAFWHSHAASFSSNRLCQLLLFAHVSTLSTVQTRHSKKKTTHRALNPRSVYPYGNSWIITPTGLCGLLCLCRYDLHKCEEQYFLQGTTIYRPWGELKRCDSQPIMKHTIAACTITC